MSSPGVSRLEALLESAQLLHASLDLDALLSHLLRSVMGRLLITRAVIAIEDKGTMRLAQVRGSSKLKVGDAYDEAKVREAGISNIFPIGDESNPVGYLGISKPVDKSGNKRIDEDETEFITALLGLAASGIANANAHSETQRVNRDLDQRVEDLRTLLDVVRGFTSALDPEGVARLLALTFTGRWAVSRYAIIAWREDHPVVTRSKGIKPVAILEARDEIGKLPDAVVINDVPEGVLKSALIEQQAEVVFVMRSGGEASGLVTLGPRRKDQGYSAADLAFGSALVGQAAVAFDNAWYFTEALERRRMEQELELAANIQEGLFPSTLPGLTGYELAAMNRPARHCGGDYYDVLPYETPAGESAYLLCVADVSGKGLPASLLMSSMQATLRALLGRIPSLTTLAEHINELLYATTPSNKYVTAVLFAVEPASGKCQYVNAGHTQCLHLKADGTAHWLAATGTPFGLMSGLPYEESSLQLDPGEMVALYSDGVTEAQNSTEDEFGEERLTQVLLPISGNPAPMIVDSLLESIDTFAGELPQYDDITIMVIKRL